MRNTHVFLTLIFHWRAMRQETAQVSTSSSILVSVLKDCTVFFFLTLIIHPCE